MLRTTSGGTQWKDVTPVGSSRQRIDVHYFYAFNSHIAWVAGTSRGATAQIFRTVDGGRTWKAITNPGVKSISFITSRDGWFLVSLGAATGSEGVDIYRSTDGGEIWGKVASAMPGSPDSGLPFGGNKSSITFLNPTTGWITGVVVTPDWVYLYVTRDGGRTWRRQNLPLPSQPQQDQPLPPQVIPHWDAWPWPPKFFTPRDGIMRVDYHHFLFDNATGDTRDGQLSVFYITHDSGTTWTYTTPVSIRHPEPRRQPSSFADMNHGWVKEGGVLHMTSDGGRRWTTIRPGPLFADVIQLNFVSPKVGWAVRNTDPYSGGSKQISPFLLKTVDGGRTWSPVTYTILRQ
ncbi:MAG: WD40/YVTN/BNR-like repeat-containing protein [bacterium]